jgi:general secretion pathway protein J
MGSNSKGINNPLINSSSLNQLPCKPIFRSSGFTLLEVLLAMSLLGMMMILLFSALSIGSKSWMQGEKKLAIVSEKTVVYQFFRRYLSTIQPLQDQTDDRKKVLSFNGEPQRLQFVSMLPISSGRYGFQNFIIEPDPQDTEQLLVKITPFYPAADGRDWKSEDVVLLSGVDDFQITYFGLTDEGGGDPLWTERWEQKTTLPLLIKILIVLQDQSTWPEMIFSIKPIQTQNLTGQKNRP